MNVLQLNLVYDPAIPSPESLLDTYSTLTGWGEALLAAGASRVSTVQRFHANADVIRNGVQYHFRNDGRGAALRSWQSARSIHGIVRHARPDVLHLNGLVFPVATRHLRRVLEPASALIVQDHATGDPEVTFPRAHRGRRMLWRACMSGVDAVLFSAAEQAERWRHAGVLPAPAHVVLESSTSLQPTARDEARAATGLAGEPAILWVGRLNPNKDPLTVLAGFERAAPRMPRATLTMVFGEDTYGGQVQARVGESAILRDRVRLVGRVPRERMPEWYSAADIFVLGSHHEGSGYALLEALACGVVPVVTAIPSFKAITGGAGAQWARGDADSCAAALLLVANGHRESMTADVRDRFARHLSWASVGRDALDAYERVLARRRVARL